MAAVSIAAPARAAPSPSPAREGPAELSPQAPLEARLEIDASLAGASAEVLTRRLHERANIVLRHANILPGGDDDPRVRIVVRELGGEEPGYLIRFELQADSDELLTELTSIECQLCTETELVARVEAELDPQLAALREVLISAEPAQVITDEPDLADPPEASEPRGHTGLLVGGVASLLLGGAALGTGIALTVPSPSIDTANPLDLITTRPPGYALLASGLVLTVAGAVMTALAVKRRRDARWSIAPYGGLRQAGLRFDWSFQ